MKGGKFMEIKKIEKNVVDYPKSNEISKKIIKKCLPNKFFKFAMSLAFIQSFSNKIKVLAAELSGGVQVVDTIVEPIPMITSGVVEYVPSPMYVISSKVGLISASIMALSLISLCLTKIIRKLKKIEKPTPKGIKVVTVISGVLTVIGVVGTIIFD